MGYRVQEQLATIGANTAVGRTPDVSGTLTIQGTSVTAVQISANLASLVSDDDRRDGQLRRQAIETETYPTATFTLTTPTYGIQKPTSFIVLSVADEGTMELQLFFTKS